MEQRAVGFEGTLKTTKQGYSGRKVEAGRRFKVTGLNRDRLGIVWGYVIDVERKKPLSNGSMVSVLGVTTTWLEANMQ